MPIFYTDSGSFNNLEVTGSTILSGSLVVSGATNFGPSGLTGSLFGTSSIAQTASFVEFTNIANRPALVSSSAQISYTGIANIPADIVSSAAQVKSFLPSDAVSSSAFTSPSQGTVRATINGVQTDVDTGLQTGDSPQFTNLFVSSTVTASIVSASTALTASNVQLNNLTDTTATNKVLVLNTATNQIFTTASVGSGGPGGNAFPFNGNAVITGSLFISQSISGTPALRGTGSIDFVTGSSRISTTADAINLVGDSSANISIGNGGFITFFAGGGNIASINGTGINPDNLGAWLGDPGDGDNLRWFLYSKTIDNSGTIGSQIITTTAFTASNARINGSVSASSYTSSLNNQVGYFGTSSWAVSASWAPGGTGTAFPFNGNAIITGSLLVSGSGTTPALQVTGSTQFRGSGSTVFSVSGSLGPLFEVIDSASGELFTISSASIDIFKIDNQKNVNVSGSLRVNGPTTLSGSLIVSSSNNNSPVTISGSTDSFFELEVVNFSAGNNASSDIVVSSNNTTDFGNYIDLGINSTTFNGPLVGGASDGYLYFTSSVGELDIGHAHPGANSNIRLFTNGPNSTANTRVFISASGNVGIGTTTNLLNRLTVQGSVSASSVTSSFTGSFTGALTHFNPATLKLTVGTTAPTSPAVNDLWVDTN